VGDEEALEVVDRDGRPERVVTRAAMRAANLRHRAVYIVVRRADGAVLVHQRAAWKDIWPSRWDVAFGGVCAVGESWAQAAHRELAEETGVDAALVDLGPVVFESTATQVVGRVFGATHDGPFTFPDGEVADSAWIPAASLREWAATHELVDDSEAVVLPGLVGRAH
jgi:8-oxo-dGTP pyrophosphatase MutT (NUDIX family)